MKIETKFSVGDRVVTISSFDARRIVKCGVCVGGKVTIAGEDFVCPKCSGASSHPVYAGTRWAISERSVVGKIEANYQPNNAYHPDEPAMQITYMIESTGVGSGTLWKECHVFATDKEAQGACDRLNAGIDFENECEPGTPLL